MGASPRGSQPAATGCSGRSPPRRALSHFGAGIGARAELNRSWAIVGEFYPFIAEGIEQHVEELGSASAFSAGVMLTTAGHQFSLVIGNSTAVGERRLMAGTPGFTGLYLGFNIQRRLP